MDKANDAASMKPANVKRGKELGELALWGSVGYTGRAFAPASQSYPGVDFNTLNYTHVADSGEFPLPTSSRAALSNLVPLVHGMQWEAGFALEAGPLSTWSN